MEREDLYGYQASPGEHTSSNRDSIPFLDKVPPDAEIRMAVKALRNGKMGRGLMMQAEHLKA